MDRLGASIIDWWQEAGVDCVVDDLPRDWLAAKAAPGNAPVAPSALPAPTPAALPADLAAFRLWLRTADEVPGPQAARIDAAGDPAGGTMIVVDMPEASDRAEGRLVSGPAGDLLDRMLPPAGLTRETVYLAPLSPARPASARLDAETCVGLARLMRHHIGLAAPRRLLIFGDAAVRALLEMSCAEARGRVHWLSVGERTIPAVASYHPRFLVQTPARKAAAWADLKLFMGL